MTREREQRGGNRGWRVGKRDKVLSREIETERKERECEKARGR